MFFKCSSAKQLLNQQAKLSIKFTARLFWDISIMESDCPAYAKNRINLQLIANHPVSQFKA
ncbi:hypothetical protein DXD09_01985 [Ligilactobacillus ruminis]|uniref:Uncharacterized protein n=1 Tax=Ligilactobacillus ruminis TaxID=1623 RepID=A0A8B2Z7G3_9LACO|nr:hypothetical protein DXD09_01985 [Ligilactobacillus ruminis]